MRKTLSIIVQNEAGVLARISAVFSMRSFNIESIAVGPTENANRSKIIIVTVGNDQSIEQIAKQLNKLIQVVEVKDISKVDCVERELMLLKVEASESTQMKILKIAEIFNAKTVDLSPDSITLETTGEPQKISMMYQMLKRYKIVDIARTGKIAIEKVSFNN